MREVTATIVFNSLTHASIKGLRGPMESQQIIFEAEDLSIHVRVSKREQERVILGQILEESAQGSHSTCTLPLRSLSPRRGKVRIGVLRI